MARASTYTLLSLDRFASIIGITPAHFNGGKGDTYFPDINACDDIFYQYAWQHYNNVSREDIGRAIKQAEDDITAVLGFSPAPVWVEDEVHRYPQHHRRDVWEYGMMTVRGAGKSVKLDYGRFIQAGRRATTAVQAGAAVVLSDADGDGYKETATITAATALTDKCEIKVYYAGHAAAQEWEIRPPRTVTLSGGNVTFTFWAWQLLDPDLMETVPTPTGPTPIDIEAAASYVTTVDIYREYTDFTQASATLYWEPAPNLALYNSGIVGVCCNACGGVGCPACQLTTQDGCIHVRDVELGWAVPAAASYDSDNAQWVSSNLTVCRDPDLIKVWYYAGDLSQEYQRGLSCDPLSHWWAEAITWLAVARTVNPFCTCNNSLTLVQEWQRDLSFTGSRELGSFSISPADLDNPFGTRKGEVMAWRRVGRMSKAVVGGTV